MHDVLNDVCDQLVGETAENLRMTWTFRNIQKGVKDCIYAIGPIDLGIEVINLNRLHWRSVGKGIFIKLIMMMTVWWSFDFI